MLVGGYTCLLFNPRNGRMIPTDEGLFPGVAQPPASLVPLPGGLRRRSLTSVLTLVSRQRHQPRRGGWSCWWGRGRWSCRTLGIPSWGILNDCNAGLSPRHHGFSKTCFGLPTLHGMISAAESFLTYRGWFMVVWYVLSLDLAQPQPSTP